MYVLAIFGEFLWGGLCVVAPTLTRSSKTYFPKQHLIHFHFIGHMTIKSRLNQTKKTPLVLALFISNLLPNYRLLNSILLRTYIRDLLSQIKPLLPYLFSLPKNQMEDCVFVLIIIN